MDVGTLVRVVEARSIVDDRWLVVIEGAGRIRVDRWLSEDPYPRAGVSAFPDLSGSPVGGEEWVTLQGRMRRVLADLAELGDTVARATFQLDDDPSIGSFQLAAVGPFPDLDRQRVLCAPSASERCALLNDLLDDVSGLAELRLEIEEEADGSWG